MEKPENNSEENKPSEIESVLVEQAREISRGRIQDMPRWME